MNTIATLRVPVSQMAIPPERTYYLHGKLPVAWPPRKPKAIVTRTNLFLRSMPASQMEKLDGSLRTVDLDRGQYLCGQGEIPEYVYFPETAVISHLKMLADGRIVEVALTGREGTVGMSSVFGSGVSASCSQVAQAGLAVRIEREVLMKMARIHPELVALLLGNIDQHVSDISQRVICNMFHDVKQRLSAWLLTVGKLSGKSMIEATHEQIARSLGVYRPTVTSIAIEMRKENLIQYFRSTIVLKDRTGLEQAACACYTGLSAAC